MNVPFPHAAVFDEGEPRRWIEQEILPAYVRGCRWFGGKARDPQTFELTELLRLPGIGEAARLGLVRIVYRDGTSDLYQLALAVLRGAQAREVAAEFPAAVVAQLDDAIICDAIYDVTFRDALVAMIAKSQSIEGERGKLNGAGGTELPRLLGGALPLPSRVLKVEQSNSSILYGSGLFVKIVRKLEGGINPDAETLRFLTEQCAFPHAPAFGGTLEFQSAGGEPRLLALATSVVVNEGDAWAFTLQEVAGFLDRAVAAEGAPPTEIYARHSGDSLLRHTIGDAFLARAAQLGRRTGEMHAALASEEEDPAFAPEPLTSADLQELQAVTAGALETVLALARESLPKLPASSRGEVARLLGAGPALQVLAAGAASGEIDAAKTRHHGDYHLGQVLNTGSDFVIIDFEGEPARSLAERRRKRSPLRDVAGMLRSFHYAAHCGIRAHRGDREMLTPWGEQWSKLIGETFLDAWTDATAGAVFVPKDTADRDRLLEAYLLEKAVYEVGYELNNRPDWVDIPIRGLLRIVDAG